MTPIEHQFIHWIFIALFLSAGMSWFVLGNFFRKKDLASLIKNGLKTEAKILGYEWRGDGKGRHVVVIFEFTPIDASGPISYSKTIWGKMRLEPGSVVSVHYNATFPMLSAIDAHGFKQNLESFSESV